MSRILTVFGGSDTSGAQRMAWRTTEAVARLGHDVAVLTPAAPPEFAADWLLLDPQSSNSDLVAVFRPDVVHGYDLALPADVDRAAQLADLVGARFVVTPASTREVWPRPAAAAALCRRAAALYVLTGAEVESMIRIGVEDDRLHRLPTAPDVTGRPRPGAFRERRGIADDLVLFLGRRVAQKGYRELLRAAPLVWRDRPGTVFAFAGPYGEPAARAVFAAARDPRIVDLGVVDEQTKHDALAACDVFCLPSMADVFPLVFAEAWSTGRAVVTGRFPGVEHVVTDGVDAVVSGHRPEELAGHLLRLLSDPLAREALGAAGARRVRAEMGWDRVATAVAAGYELP